MTTVTVVGGRQLTAPAGSSASLTRLPDLLPASLQHLDLLAIIGYGAYAQVAEVRSRRSGEHYALKVVEKQPLAARGMLQQLAREFGVQRGVRHPHTVQAVELAEDLAHAYLLLELCIGGSVWQATHRFPNSVVPEPTAAQWLSDATVGCAHLHELGLVHRDVKLENLLIDGTGYVKLCDFGWCAFEADEPQGMCGTPQLAAPEVSLGEPQTVKVDAWALGACLVQMLKGRPLAGSQDAWLPRTASIPAKDVGTGFLTVDPSARLAASEALDYLFVKACLRPETANFKADAVAGSVEAESRADCEVQQSPAAASPRVMRRSSAPSHPQQQQRGKALPAPTRLVSGPSSTWKTSDAAAPSPNAPSLRRLYSQPPQHEKRGSSPAPVLGGAAATQARLSQMAFKAPAKPNSSDAPSKPNPAEASSKPNRAVSPRSPADASSKPTRPVSPRNPLTRPETPRKPLAGAMAAAAGAAPEIIARVRANSAAKLNSPICNTARKPPSLAGISQVASSPRLNLRSPEQASRAHPTAPLTPSARTRQGSSTQAKVEASEVRPNIQRGVPLMNEISEIRREVADGEITAQAISRVKKLVREVLEAAESLKLLHSGDFQAKTSNRLEEEALLRNFLNSPKPEQAIVASENGMGTARKCIETSRILTDRSLLRCGWMQ